MGYNYENTRLSNIDTPVYLFKHSASSVANCSPSSKAAEGIQVALPELPHRQDPMNDYQREQLEALDQVNQHVKALALDEKGKLRALMAEYLEFRARVDSFLKAYFSVICDRTCYRSRISACCSREGIITFFSDMAINLLLSDDAEIDALYHVLRMENTGFKCVYLGSDGCLWRVKPIVCQMFLCDSAKARVFGEHPEAAVEWQDLERQRKLFTWPDRPVLFDMLEAYFMAAGCSSLLMYLHTSPGLLAVKKKAGL